jgi:hypothetical protein
MIQQLSKLLKECGFAPADCPREADGTTPALAYSVTIRKVIQWLGVYSKHPEIKLGTTRNNWFLIWHDDDPFKVPQSFTESPSAYEAIHKALIHFKEKKDNFA